MRASRLQWPTVADGSQPVAEQVVEQLAQWVSVSSDGNVALRTLSENELLATTSFALASPTASGGLFSFWGRGAVSNFDEREGDLTLDGDHLAAGDGLELGTMAGRWRGQAFHRRAAPLPQYQQRRLCRDGRRRLR